MTSSGGITYPLTIGSVTLNEGAFEGPNGDAGGLSDLGSKQKAVVKEFPGGIMTAQLYGSFPKSIAWSGKLFGSNAISRSFELQKLCDNGDLITFSWAQWTFQGFVEDYEVIARAFNHIEYKIVFKPLENDSTVTGGNNLASNDPFASTVSNAQNTMTQQSLSPASGGALPAPVQSGVTNLNKSVSQALQQTGGGVANIPASMLSNLQNQISSLQQLLSPIINGSDPVAASAAADLNGTLSVLNTAFGQSLNPLITTLQVVNPNLYSLSAQFYGTPLLYWVIQDANALSDPLPITGGPIQLKIPVAPALTTGSTPTVFQDALNAA